MTHPHNCREMLGALSDYVDEALSPQVCAEIEKHLAECQNCRVVVDTLKKTVYLVQQTIPNENLPEDVRTRLFLTLNLEEFLHP